MIKIFTSFLIFLNVTILCFATDIKWTPGPGPAPAPYSKRARMEMGAKYDDEDQSNEMAEESSNPMKTLAFFLGVGILIWYLNRRTNSHSPSTSQQGHSLRGEEKNQKNFLSKIFTRKSEPVNQDKQENLREARLKRFNNLGDEKDDHTEVIMEDRQMKGKTTTRNRGDKKRGKVNTLFSSNEVEEEDNSKDGYFGGDSTLTYDPDE